MGRAPGGSAEATNALSDNFLQKVYKMPELLKDLLHFFNNDFPKDHEFSKVTASPLPPVTPEIWLLGTSKKSAALAAKNGMASAFGQFISEKNGAEIIQQYVDAFEPVKKDQLPQSLLTVSAICAETTEEAEEIALSSLIWQLQTEKGQGQSIPTIEEAKKYDLTDKEKDKLKIMKQNMIIGN
ncbi:LLM class flavin-dependent oxidoreductase [Bacillus niameyensis]|uniref:LLM class flavin-dependent oxidoreductase n=1 Tax=Bacillus niameyensis TaxID=1522308 RepID=UPI0022812C45|nr:LLM class flavin-dependent oxidoreductase [Bacillus niameyensis]